MKPEFRELCKSLFSSNACLPVSSVYQGSQWTNDRDGHRGLLCPLMTNPRVWGIKTRSFMPLFNGAAVRNPSHSSLRHKPSPSSLTQEIFKATGKCDKSFETILLSATGLNGHANIPHSFPNHWCKAETAILVTSLLPIVLIATSSKSPRSTQKSPDQWQKGEFQPQM